MRLTLRTLLAYMDGVLSPEEQEELKKQIEASELASELIHRTGDVVRRPQVGVPEVLGLGPIDDPNTMAEYLDGTLPDENVADFERACLDSEMMLAEAASAHHALKLVLSKEGDVDLDTLKRMQWLPHILQEAIQVRAEPSHASDETPHANTAKIEASAGDQQADENKLPGYLREQRERQKSRAAWLRWAPAIASLLLLGTTAFLIFGSNNQSEDAEVAKQETPAIDDQQEVSKKDALESKAGDLPQDSRETNATDADASPALELGEEGQTAETDDSAEAIASKEPDDSVVLSTSGGDNQLDAEGSSTKEDSNPEPATDALTDASEEAPTAVAVASEENDESQALGDKSADVSPREPAKPVFSGPESTLLVMEVEPEVWSRVSVGQELINGNRMVAMPTYRPAITLGENLRIELVDYSEAIVDAPTALSEAIASDVPIPSIRIAHGQLLLQNLSPEEVVKFNLLIDGARCTIALEPGLPLAIEVDRTFAPGLDLLNQSPQVTTQVYAQGGNVTWEANGGIYKASQAKQWELTSKGEPSGLRDFAGDPGWIEGLNNNAWDRRASPQLPKRVVAEQEVWPQLREIVESDSYKEVRALAAHCSLAVGHPDVLVSSFDDESQQASWARNLEKLRVAASRSQVEASRIHRAMEEQYGEKLSADLFVLLCGFGSEEVGETDEELQRGAILQLIDWLESDSLACRALAMLNLEQLTGRIAIYNPTDQSGRRRSDIRKIRKRLRENDLRLDAAVE